MSLVVAGVAVNCWNTTFPGLVATPQSSSGVLGNVGAASCFPSLIEIGVALGIVTVALLGFTLGMRYLGLYPAPDKI